MCTWEDGTASLPSVRRGGQHESLFKYNPCILRPCPRGRSFFSHQPYLITHQLYLTSVRYSPVMFHFQRRCRSERQKQTYWQQRFAVKPLSQDGERWTCQDPPWWRMEQWDPVYDKTELKQRKVSVRKVFFFFFLLYISRCIYDFPLPSMTGFEVPLTKYRRQVYSIYFGAISQPSHEALTAKDWSQFICSPLHCRHRTNTFLQGKHWDTLHVRVTSCILMLLILQTSVDFHSSTLWYEIDLQADFIQKRKKHSFFSVSGGRMLHNKW